MLRFFLSFCFCFAAAEALPTEFPFMVRLFLGFALSAVKAQLRAHKFLCVLVLPRRNWLGGLWAAAAAAAAGWLAWGCCRCCCRRGFWLVLLLLCWRCLCWLPCAGLRCRCGPAAGAAAAAGPAAAAAWGGPRLLPALLLLLLLLLVLQVLCQFPPRSPVAALGTQRRSIRILL